MGKKFELSIFLTIVILVIIFAILFLIFVSLKGINFACVSNPLVYGVKQMEVSTNGYDDLNNPYTSQCICSTTNPEYKTIRVTSEGMEEFGVTNERANEFGVAFKGIEVVEE